MPPKGRSARSRGRGRGGGTDSSRKNPSQVERADPPAESSETTPSAESTPAQPKVQPAPNDVADASAGSVPPVALTHAEAQSMHSSRPSSPNTTTNAGSRLLPGHESSPNAETDTLARPPVQRLDTVKNAATPTSRSSSPSSRAGSSARGGRGPAATRGPTFKGRRSKEERDAREKAAIERDRERKAEREAQARKERKWNHRGGRVRGRGGASGRGGYMGVGDGPVSGPFSSGVSNKASRPNIYLPSGSRATRVKDEDDDSDVNRRLGITVKKEDGYYVSSDDDDEVIAVPKKDIDTIQISSDEDETGTLDRKERRYRGDTPAMLMPIRIARKEHRDRVVGINTEASSATSAKILQQAEAAGESPTVEGVENVTRKGKGKGKGKVKDVEITEWRRPYKGMWQDEDDLDIKIKTETLSEDEDAVDSEELAEEISKNVVKKQSGSSPEAERKPKLRNKHGLLDAEPVLQTDEEKTEWARFQSSLHEIRRELGPDEKLAIQNTSGDVTMRDPEATKHSVRDDAVYLFQLPPIMPDLLPPGARKELADPNSQPAASSANTDQTPIKVEDGAKEAPISSLKGLQLGSGRVGKLRVHESGRTTLDWGGTSFELNLGQTAHFLQETVCTKITPEKDRVAPEDGGEAVSFGRVRGKFVVVPDWSDMLR